ncbi:MAG: PIN domain-containing protein [Fimbriimonadales bacterium]|nr:PIN domain-containing protein [Fimbriimonadales bacterium]
MILCDTGAIIATLNASDRQHARCVQALNQITPAPFLMTQACFTETMYFLFKVGGAPLQERLWMLWETGKLRLYELSNDEMARVRVLMQKYQDVPMDYADATIVAVAESTGIHTLFTIDSEFYIYRIYDTEAFQIIPP